MEHIFGKVIGYCHCCGRLLFDNSKYYIVKMRRYETEIFCFDCVKLVNQEDGE